MSSVLSVTNIGLAAIANAEAGGFLVDVVEFKVSEFDTGGLASSDFIAAEGLSGAPVYEAKISSIEVVDAASVKLTLNIPAKVPATGTWQLREIGLFLATGELFAYGALEPVYEKTSEFSVRIYALLVADRIGANINVTVSQDTSLPATPHISGLVPPADSYQNAILVLDENANDFMDMPSTSLALKSGPGGTQWSFVGYNRIYNGYVDVITDLNSFVLNPDRGGFWLNDGEVVIGQIVSGIGDGFSRKLKYAKATNTFTVVDKPWQRFSSASKIAIWRSVKNQLPSRTAALEDYLVLGVGVKSWKSSTTSEISKKYTCKTASGTIAGGAFSHSNITGGTEVTTFVFVDGVCLPYGSFTVATSSILLSGYDGKAVDVVVMVEEDSDIGGSLAKFESTYTTDGVIVRFYLPIVPDSKDCIEAYWNDTFIPSSQYELDGTSLLFTAAPAPGVLTLASFASYEEDETATQVKRFLYQAVEGQTLEFPLDADSIDKNRFVVYAGGKYFGEDCYTVTGDTITLTKTPTYTNGFATVDITAFVRVSGAALTTVSGTDTGPVWTDPAGRMGPPNKLVPVVIPYTSNGVDTVYSVMNVPRKSNIIMMAGGAYQDPRNHRYTKGSKSDLFGTLKLAQAIPFGVKIDFICFTDVEDEGTSVVCEVHKFITTNALSYTIPSCEGASSIFITVGGAYQHSQGFSVVNHTMLNLVEVEPGLEAEVWYFKTVPSTGLRTEMYVDYGILGAINKYPLKHRVERKENTFVFVGSVYQHKSNYNLVESDGAQQAAFAESPGRTYFGLPIITVSFVSGDPLTRLLLREEAEETFIPRNGPFIDWSNFSYKLRSTLACPITRVLGIMTGAYQPTYSNGNANEQQLTHKYGIYPFTKTATLEVLPTAAYSGVSTGAMVGMKSSFNVYKYLELLLKQELNNASFTIHSYEQNFKYVVEDIDLSALTYSALAKSDIPMITGSTGIFINYPTAIYSSTNATLPLMTNFFDMAWSLANVTLPTGFTASSLKPKTVSVSVIEDDYTQTRTFVHEIESAEGTYVVKWCRPARVTDQDSDYMTLVDAGGAPSYVQYFARLYAEWQYSDADLIKCMHYNKQPCGKSAVVSSEVFWGDWFDAVRGGSTGGNYPAVSNDSAGLMFTVAADSFNPTTGACNLSIGVAGGGINYSYYPAEMLLSKIEIPVKYRICPAVVVYPDGTSDSVIGAKDLFDPCCWTNTYASNDPEEMDCGTGLTFINVPTVDTMMTNSKTPTLQGTYPYAAATGLTIKVNGVTYVKGVSPALTTDKDIWTLNLAATTNSLPLKFNDVEVEVTTGTEVLKDKSLNEIFVYEEGEVVPTFESPTVDSVSTYTGLPIVTGTYPTAYATGGFTVTLNGWTYVLNSLTVFDTEMNARNLAEAALTAKGQFWTLDMTKDAEHALAPGIYDVVASVCTAEGVYITDKTTGEVSYNLIIANSIRFNSAFNTRAERIFLAAGDPQKMTLAFWFKVAADSVGTIFATPIVAGTSDFALQIANGRIRLYDESTSTILAQTADQFLDNTEWQQATIGIDTTQATADARISIEIGRQARALSINTITQNQALRFNQAGLHTIGRAASRAASYFPGYLADFHLVTGAKVPSTEFTMLRGMSVGPAPYSKKYPYGPNGFYLPFKGATVFVPEDNLQQTETAYTEPGTYDVTVPAGTVATFTGIGGGGAGGGGATNSNWVQMTASAAGGGGGGGKSSTTIAGPATVRLVVGAGGAWVGGGANGNNGGDTIISVDGVVKAVAGGGKGGHGGVVGSGSANPGGAGGTGDVPGGAGGQGGAMRADTGGAHYYAGSTAGGGPNPGAAGNADLDYGYGHYGGGGGGSAYYDTSKGGNGANVAGVHGAFGGGGGGGSYSASCDANDGALNGGNGSGGSGGNGLVHVVFATYAKQEYSTPGTYSIVVPQGGYALIVGGTGAGGGGAGGGCTTGGNYNYQASGGGGGGGGAETKAEQSLEVAAGDILTIKVGAGGAGGAPGYYNAWGSDGGAGGETAVYRNGTLIFTVAPGSGGHGGSGSPYSGKYGKGGASPVGYVGGEGGQWQCGPSGDPAGPAYSVAGTGPNAGAKGTGGGAGWSQPGGGGGGTSHPNGYGGGGGGDSLSAGSAIYVSNRAWVYDNAAVSYSAVGAQWMELKVQGGKCYYKLYDSSDFTLWTGATTPWSTTSYGARWRNEGEAIRITSMDYNASTGAVAVGLQVYDAYYGVRWSGTWNTNVSEWTQISEPTKGADGAFGGGGGGGRSGHPWTACGAYGGKGGDGVLTLQFLGAAAPPQSHDLFEDTSGNNNHFIGRGFIREDSYKECRMQDTPSKNYPILDYKRVPGGSEQALVLSNGGLDFTAGSGAAQASYSQGTTLSFIGGNQYLELTTLAATTVSNYKYPKLLLVNPLNYAVVATIATADPATGAITGVAIDFTNGKYWVRDNSVNWSSGDPATSSAPSGTFTPISTGLMVCPMCYGGASGALNFGQRAFKWEAPAGFGLADTIKTPTASSFVFNFVISSNSTAFNLRTAAIAAGWNGVIPLDATVTVNTGIFLRGTYSAPSFSAEGSFPVGSKLVLNNNGFIIGVGGILTYNQNYNGGKAVVISGISTIINNTSWIVSGGGGGGYGSGKHDASSDAIHGASGGTLSGDAITVSSAVSINNTGTIAAGGNGASGTSGDYPSPTAGDGGGGAGEGKGGNLNYGWSGNPIASQGDATYNTPGNGTYGGATGGELGTGSGKAIVGNAKIVWLSQGTVIGTVS